MCYIIAYVMRIRVWGGGGDTTVCQFAQLLNKNFAKNLPSRRYLSLSSAAEATWYRRQNQFEYERNIVYRNRRGGWPYCATLRKNVC